MYEHDKEIKRLRRTRKFGIVGAIVLGLIIGLFVGGGLSAITFIIVFLIISWWAGVSNEISEKERRRMIHGRRNSTDRR